MWFLLFRACCWKLPLLELFAAGQRNTCVCQTKVVVVREGGEVLGLRQRGDKFLLQPRQGQDAQRVVVCGSERAQALSIVEV